MRKITSIIFVIYFALTGLCYAENHYIRASATGSNSGNDWTAAWTDLPASFVRGDTYFVAGGTYGGHTFNTDLSGTATITIKKATTSDHGSDTGWDKAYGDGVAEFTGGFVINTGYWVIDGVTGGGPESWTTGFGFKMTFAVVSADGAFIEYGVNGHNNVVKHIDIGNVISPGPGCGRSVYSLGGNNNSISYSYIHRIGDVGMTILNSTGWVIEYNRMDRMSESGIIPGSCGGDGVKESHGAMLELSGYTYNFTLRYNNISNTAGTGWIGIYDTGTGYVDGLYIYGNLFYNTNDYSGTANNGIVYNVSGTTEPIKNILIFNNTFAYLNPTAILGLTKDIGQSRAHPDSTGNFFKNNIVYGSGAASYIINTKDYNASDKAISGDTHLQILSSNPFTDSARYNFHLSKSTQTGYTFIGSYYGTDMDGVVRGADSVWDRGAYEYVGKPPVAPFNVKVQ